FRAAAPQKETNPAKEAKDAEADGNKKGDKTAKKDDEAAKDKKPVAAAAKALPAAALRLRAAAVRGQGGGGEQQVIRRQLEPMLKVELSFAIRAAQLNADDRNTLITSCKKWFDDFLPDYIKSMDPNQKNMLMQGAQIVVFGNAPAGNRKQANAR